MAGQSYQLFFAPPPRRLIPAPSKGKHVRVHLQERRRRYRGCPVSLSGRGQFLRLSDLERAVQCRQHVRPLYRGRRRATVRTDGEHRGRYARARGAPRFQREQMARRARHPCQRWPGRLRDCFVPEGWRQTHCRSAGADVCAGDRRQPYRLSSHAHDRARRAHTLGADGACRVDRSSHHPQRHC